MLNFYTIFESCKLFLMLLALMILSQYFKSHHEIPIARCVIEREIVCNITLMELY